MIPVTIAKDMQRRHVPKRASVENFDVQKMTETIGIKSTAFYLKYSANFQVRKVSRST
jgi:hypothetical protein